MKKVLLSLLLFLITPLIVNADVNDYILESRTEANLHVNKPEIQITDSNIDNILATPYVKASQKVFDFADVLTDTEEDGLYNEIMNFISAYNIDMVVVTIDKEWSDSQIIEFADDFFDYNDFGMYTSETSYDGILAIRNANDYNRYYYVSTSGMGQLYFTYDRVNDILDYMYTNMHNDNYYNAFLDFIDKSSEIMQLGLPKKYEGCHVDNYGNLYDEDGNRLNFSVGRYVAPILPAFIVSLVTSIIVILILIGKNKMVRKAVQATEYLNKDSIEITKRNDMFVSSHTTHYTVSSSSSGGGSHSGSSGFSHGGGGRHC